MAMFHIVSRILRLEPISESRNLRDQPRKLEGAIARSICATLASVARNSYCIIDCAATSSAHFRDNILLSAVLVNSLFG